MAASVFQSRIAKAGLDGQVEADSAGTGGWHAGDSADPRTAATLTAAGYDPTHAARQFRSDWFDRLDLVIALDRGHERELRRMAPSAADADKVRLLRSYDPQACGDLDVPDPYYGGRGLFDTVLAQVEAAVPGLLNAVRKELENR
ncbi:low molecular weight protein-tyrosine-phosphatase [Streptomyces gobiensis]|uniref:low molecular weight protein-tyrosine-phosphatase n=1 Tax=Streptomyces gobiensis TaxID=2875706 RepID=UPI003BAFEB6F